ncbi:hypothetical protein IV203_032575 [Nitzschia inconspicua]|uniref:Uncharacterized protein n=1 Tax=Nitzschia inconspicua TaxID=303405 RepID=A0A9K3PHE6_9STRA|nr:hypothetical protein IV203_032575 [Nitzschia inconspicua]
MSWNNENEDDLGYQKELDRMAMLMEKQQKAETDSSAKRSSQKENPAYSVGTSYSLEILTVVVSLLFVAMVTIFGDKFVVTGNNSVLNTSSSFQPTKIIDADALLREEFQNLPSSVEFH